MGQFLFWNVKKAGTMSERTLKLSDKGLALIKEFEGCHRKTDDGRFRAYLCPAGVPTIGWGCTHGVKMGMVWTAEECELKLREELADIEAGVRRLVTVPLEQSQYDALVSFAYNLGLGNLGRSTLLKKLNRNDYEGARKELLKWVFHADPKNGGRVKSRGLIRRRHAEFAMWDDYLEDDAMPQDVAPEPPSAKPAVAVGGGAAAGVGGAAMIEQIPAPPDLSQVMSWKAFGSSVGDVGSAVVSSPMTYGIAIGLALVILNWQRISGFWRSE